MSWGEHLPPLRSPDGSVEVRRHRFEASMAGYVTTPTVIRARDGWQATELSDRWDCERGVAFPRPGVVELRLRRFPDGDRVYVTVIDVEAATFCLDSGCAPDRPLGELPGALAVASGWCWSCGTRLEPEPGADRVTCGYCRRDWPVGDHS